VTKRTKQKAVIDEMKRKRNMLHQNGQQIQAP
jgi:hypothetical protein